MVRHPIQPLEMVGNVLRFKRNAIVDDLLDLQAISHIGQSPERVAELRQRAGATGLDLNRIAFLVHEGVYSAEDRIQLVQLIGYSHSGVPSYVPTEILNAAERQWRTGVDEWEARYHALLEWVNTLLPSLRDAAACAFRIHPDDLQPEFGEVTP